MLSSQSLQLLLLILSILCELIANFLIQTLLMLITLLPELINPARKILIGLPLITQLPLRGVQLALSLSKFVREIPVLLLQLPDLLLLLLEERLQAVQLLLGDGFEAGEASLVGFVEGCLLGAEVCLIVLLQLQMLGCQLQEPLPVLLCLLLEILICVVLLRHH